MTDKDKAIQILRILRGTWIPPIGAVFSPIDCVQGLMAMSEWKEQQFKEYLEKKKEALYYKTDTVSVCKYALLVEIAKELFDKNE